eukprot:Skav220080  [mRNA]  locus=scaffold262:289518:292240:+ [translate_table: standard]
MLSPTHYSENAMASWWLSYFAAAKKELLDLKSRQVKRVALHWSGQVEATSTFVEGSEASFAQSVEELAGSQKVHQPPDLELPDELSPDELLLDTSPDLPQDLRPEPPQRPISRLFWLRPPSEWKLGRSTPATPVDAGDVASTEDLDGLGCAEPGRKAGGGETHLHVCTWLAIEKVSYIMPYLVLECNRMYWILFKDQSLLREEVCGVDCDEVDSCRLGDKFATGVGC